MPTLLALLLSVAALATPKPNLADAVASGDCATVLEWVDASDPGDWRLARGWCLLKTGDAKGAEKTLAVPIDGVLGEYSRLYLARARLKLGDADGAAKALHGLKLPGPTGTELRLTQARLAVQRKDGPGFEALAKGLNDPEIRFLRGELQWALSAKSDAIATWRTLVTAAEVGGWDTKAMAKLKAAGETVSFDPYARALQLKKNGRVLEAAEVARKGAVAKTAEQHVALARLYMAARSYDEALRHWKAAVGAPGESVGSAGSLFDYALSYARKGDYATAATVYRRVMAQHPGSEEAVFASYKLGYMAYDAGDCGEAIRLYDGHMSAHPGSKYLDEALWFSARCHWKAGEVDAMATKLDRLMSRRPSSSLVPGAAYWKARALGLTGDAAGEEKGLQSVISRWPTSGHAWFAAQRLGRSFPAKPLATRPAWPAALASDPAVVRGEALLAQGFRSFAAAELDKVVGKATASGKAGSLAAAWALLEAGDYKGAQSLARKYCVSPWKEGDPVAQQVCTPRPEASIVSAVAAKYDLHPLVPYGIMTAESALDPSVTSPAGARGLMQLMPAEGPRIHEALYPGRPYDPDDLYSAPYNASMGTAELGMKRQSLVGVLDGTDLPAVIASYNAGETPVRGWVEAAEAEKPPFDAWAEDVGYSETRRYVKRVLGFVMAYRWVYGDP